LEADIIFNILTREIEYEDPTASTIIFAQHSNDYDVLRERWGVNINTEYRFDEFNKVYLNLNHNKYFDKEIRRKVEWVIDDDEETKETRNRVEDQILSMVMFGGNHNFNDIKLDYVASWIKAAEDMPARTYFRFQRDFDFSGFTNEEIKDFGPTSKFTGQETLELNRIRVDDNLKEDMDISGSLNIEIPYDLMDHSSIVKIGGKYLDKSVKFEERRLELKKFAEDHTIGEGEFGFIDVIVDPDDTDYLGASKTKYIDRSDDNYDASETILAAYAMTTINFSDKLSILAGLRFENTTNNYKTLAVESVNQEESDASYSNLLPSVHGTYKFKDNVNVRAAYSSGIARPNYTNLVPVEIIDDDDREISRGNPDLEPTTSNNFDLMCEHYSAHLGLFSAGVFYKKMTNNIISSKESETIDGEEYYWF
jgi:TonB-dependent receptor